MKNLCQVFVFLMFLIVPGTINGQNVLSIDQNEANFGKYNNNYRGWVRSVKQQFYNIAPRKSGSEMKKDGKSPIYQINTFYTKSGDVERVEGPGYQVTTHKYNENRDLLVVDQIGEYDQKYYRRITNYVYDSFGRLLEKVESTIPYRLSGDKAIYDFNNPDLRTKTEYRYNEAGKLSELIVYERHGQLYEVYRETYHYDKLGLLSEKIGTDRDGDISMRESYTYGKRTKTDYINKGIINRRIVYDSKERPEEEIGLGANDVINVIRFKYDSEGKLIEWTSHDALGNPKKIFTGIESPSFCERETYQYDMAGNRIGWSFYDGRGALLDKYFIECTYDKYGNWTRKATVENQIDLDKFVIVERKIDYY
ncbi:MAG: hypothetical protein LBI82_02415 [Dysgonamonadaceae bacterium]|jgi:hypothetical protein|nr:hypothetical protein [Dysgonamonadaceae bacterium]